MTIALKLQLKWLWPPTVYHIINDHDEGHRGHRNGMGMSFMWLFN